MNQLSECPPDLFHHWCGDGGDSLSDGGAASEGDDTDVLVFHDSFPGAGSQAAHQIHDARWEP